MKILVISESGNIAWNNSEMHERCYTAEFRHCTSACSVGFDLKDAQRQLNFPTVAATPLGAVVTQLQLLVTEK